MSINKQMKLDSTVSNQEEKLCHSALENGDCVSGWALSDVSWSSLGRCSVLV